VKILVTRRPKSWGESLRSYPSEGKNERLGEREMSKDGVHRYLSQYNGKISLKTKKGTRPAETTERGRFVFLGGLTVWGGNKKVLYLINAGWREKKYHIVRPKEGIKK